MDRIISTTEALTSCSLDEAARLSYALELRNEMQRRADKKAGA